MKNRNNINMEADRKWKNENKEYLNALQMFLDKAENIKQEELKHEIIIQMLKCDEILTKLAEEKFKETNKQEKHD